ncbi:ShlB/FhaC/HecB family hemolysin secretion/activation protein, partial [Xanthomonas perforans]|nr:ShlB/FhaC/HecB family hemolysin secretion/activation protein [Xanthomonas perforans]
MWMRSAPLALAVCLWAVAGLAAAQQSAPTTLDRQEQLRQAEEIQHRQEQERQAPFAGPREDADRVDARSTVLPKEDLCFSITRLRLSGAGDDATRFAWLWKSLRRYQGRCIGRAGIDIIRRRALDQ